MKTGLSTKLDPTKRSGEASDFDKGLRRKVIGQNDALEQIANIYNMFLAGLNAPGRPVGNLLFLGPTGSGKTRVMEAVSELLFGDTKFLLKIDCAEFQHSHEIAKLIGSPPGYLGHRETHPMLTQETLNASHRDGCKLSLLLLDEIEKASDALWQLLLGIMDKATLTLGDNRKVDFSQTLIVMTSNLGAAEVQDLMGGGGIGFNAGTPPPADKVDASADRISIERARRKFTPEFMNRLDKIVVFKPLRDEHLKQILEIELGLVQQRILMSVSNKQFVFSCTPRMKEFLLAEGTDRKYGARHLKRALERNIVHPFANMVSTGQIKLGDFIRVDRDGEETTFTKEAEGAMVPALLSQEWTPKKLEDPK